VITKTSLKNQDDRRPVVNVLTWSRYRLLSIIH